MQSLSSIARPAALLLAAVLAGAPASAADVKAPASKPQTAYEKERAVCLSGKSNQDRETCLKEAANAAADGKKGALDDKGAAYTDNARKRCEVQTGDDRAACLARMKGQGTTSGDPKAGGVLREYTERGIPASAAK